MKNDKTSGFDAVYTVPRIFERPKNKDVTGNIFLQRRHFEHTTTGF